MHTSKDDYLINTLRFVSRKEASQIYGAVLPECLTSPEMKESRAYKTYLGYATGGVPPKVARKFKKASPSKKESELAPGDEVLVKKGKRLKTPAKKSASKPATGIIIREPHVETKLKRKEKEKVDVAHRKRIELLSEVSLYEKAQMKEARKKSLRDFHKTHPSGSSTIAEKPPSVEKITPTITSEGTGDKQGVPDVTNDDSSESESESCELDSEQDEESNDDDQEQEDFDQENESRVDEMKSDEEQGMEDTTDQFDDDADARLEEPTETATGVVQGEGNDTEMTEAQQGNENLETTQEQVVEDAYVTISTVLKKTEVPVTKIVSPLDVHIHHEVPRTQAPTLLTLPVLVIPESSLVFTNIPQSSYTFTPTPIQATPTPPLIIETTNPLSNLPDFSSVFRFNDRITALEKEVILPQEVSNFAPPVIKKLIKESRDEVTLAKASSQPQYTYEAGSTLTEFELKKILLDKMEKNEPVFEVADSDLPQDQEGNLGVNEDEPKDEIASRCDWFKKPTPPQEPTDPD
ncbi:hypothetical protein Tco_0575767 [Tanacetum coccineum]